MYISSTVATKLLTDFKEFNQHCVIAIQFITQRTYSYPRWAFWKHPFTVEETVEHVHTVPGTWISQHGRMFFKSDIDNDGWIWQSNEGRFHQFVMRTDSGIDLAYGGDLSQQLAPGAHIAPNFQWSTQ